MKGARFRQTGQRRVKSVAGPAGFSYLYLGEAEAKKVYSYLKPQAKSDLQFYLQELETGNQRANLTAIAKDQRFSKLLLESLVLTAIMPDLPTLPVLDLGSGAGVPGLVLSIAYPRLQVHSLDKSKAKIDFQRLVKKRLTLPNFQPMCQRAEFYQPIAAGYDHLWARAYSPLPNLLAGVVKFLAPHAKLALWKGQNWPEEWGKTPLNTRLLYSHKQAWWYEISPTHGGWLLVLTYRPIS